MQPEDSGRTVPLQLPPELCDPDPTEESGPTTICACPARRRSELPEAQRRCLLRYLQGPRAGSVVELGRQPTVAGRGDEVRVPLDDPAASRRQFEVRRWRDHYVLVDLQSTNGTQVNHVEVAECRLADGDIISVGGIDLAFLEETHISS